MIENWSPQTEGHSVCHKAERLALLDVKSHVQLQLANYRLFPSWIDDPIGECCSWDRVICNHSTGHVTKLSLDFLGYGDVRDYFSVSGWVLNISLFQPLKELNILNLSSSLIAGWTNNEDSDSLSRMKKLEILDLSNNMFNESILPSLGGLTSLKTLILADNAFGSPTAKDLQSISRLEKLEVLDLNFNNFNESIMPSLSRLPSLKTLTLARNGFGSFPAQDLSRFKSLERLDISENWAFGSVESSDTNTSGEWFSTISTENQGSLNLSNLNKIKYLDLSSNSWRGHLHIQEFSSLSNLEVLILRGNSLRRTWRIQDMSSFANLEVLDLGTNEFDGNILPGLCLLNRLKEIDLSNNNFEGNLPSCLHNLTSLRLLDLSQNNFTGSTSSSVVAGLTSLEYIDLSHNYFEGLFSFSSFANISKLEVVQFISGNDKFEIETEDSSWDPQFQLKVLVLQNCNLNKRSHKIPQFLLCQQHLKIVDLSHNMLEGIFPVWLLANNTRLEFLSLRNNSLMGQFYIQPYPLVNATHVDVSDNQIEGELQEHIGKLLPHLEYLNLSKNSFEGSLPLSFCDIRNVKVIDISSNNFSGEVGFITCCSKMLEVLELSDNSFHGQFFSTCYNWSALLVLRLSNNVFTGSLSNIKFNSFDLLLFDVSNNYISGKIPSWIGNMTQLQILDMRNNSFEGELHCEPFSANYVDLSQNFLSGSLPTCSNTLYLQQIHLQQNNFTGTLPKAFFNSSYLLALNIRDNRLSGKVPSVIGALSRLRVLLLRGNLLNGSIPKQLCQLQSISLMDLSSNSFSGSIPHCFYNITFGKMSPYYQSIAETSIYLPMWTMMHVYPDKQYFGDEGIRNGTSTLQVEVDFVTKNRSSLYKGDILNFMSGLDLSCNNLTGEIPAELGKLSWLHALNLSHNQLTGPIPRTFSMLTQTESLDLSHNSLSGEIPSELTDLYFLSAFSVAYNNFSGRIPDMKAQFSTFDSSSYEGNPLLCGPPSKRNCSGDNESPSSLKTMPHEVDGKWYEVDHVVFFASFSGSFIVFFIGVITIFYVNPYWRGKLCYHSEELMFSCYYFFYDTVFKLRARLCR